jgi:membrane-associated phospholipid phosphatase
MVDLSRPWPLGIGEQQWWRFVVIAVVVELIAVMFDHQISVWATHLPEALRNTLAQFTPYGESGWILIPTGVLLVVTALLARFTPWKLMRLMLNEFTALWAFLFVGIGLPSLISTIVKRLGRPRPMHYAKDGLFGLHPNWADWTYQSFPSGHATTAFALAACVGFISERWFYPALLFAAAIGLSRITEGVHYPSDVIGGTILGFVGAYAVRFYFARRGWLFTQGADGGIAMRPMSALKRYMSLQQRRVSARKR